MNTILTAVIVYLSGSTELYCDAVVSCHDGRCHAYPIEHCPGSYSATEDTLSGEWSLDQCLSSTVSIQGATFDALGCAPNKRELDL